MGNGIIWGTNRILVKMEPNNQINTLLQILDIPQIQYESKWYDSTIYVLIIPKGNNLLTLSNWIFESGLVEYAQPSFYHYSALNGYETNPLFGEQWNLLDTTIDNTGYTTLCYMGINAIRAWKFTTGSPNLKIAILDNGIDSTHEDLIDNFLFEKNYTGVTPANMLDAKDHGTACCGIISSADNNTGVIGICVFFWEQK